MKTRNDRLYIVGFAGGRGRSLRIRFIPVLWEYSAFMPISAKTWKPDVQGESVDTRRNKRVKGNVWVNVGMPNSKARENQLLQRQDDLDEESNPSSPC